MSEHYALRWNDFHANLTQSLVALLSEEDLVDVTLAAGGQYVHAHKLILSVSSPYFKELFKVNPCDHPTVILKDVAHHELRQILQFVYCGEVNVHHQDLIAFLHTAEMLQIKGLTSGEHRASPPLVSDDNKGPDTPEPSGDSQTEWIPGGEDTIATTESPVDFVDICTAELAPPPSLSKRLHRDAPNKNICYKKKKPSIAKSPTHRETPEYTSNGELLIESDSDVYNNVLVIQEPTKGTSGWNCKSSGVKCPSCHRYFANRYNLKVHIRDKHDTREGTLQCNICQKHMRNPSCLRVHMYHHRKQATCPTQVSPESSQRGQDLKNIIGEWSSPSSVSTTELKNGENLLPSESVEDIKDDDDPTDDGAGDASVVSKTNALSHTM